MKQNVFVFKKRLNEAFRQLRKQGFYAQQNFACCQGCGFARAEDQMKKTGKEYNGVVFYHMQDADDRDRAAYVYMAFGGKKLSDEKAAKQIVEAMKDAGVAAQWSGKTDERIRVSYAD